LLFFNFDSTVSKIRNVIFVLSIYHGPIKNNTNKVSEPINKNKFKNLRQSFSRFIYDSFEYEFSDDSIKIKFNFNLDEKIFFTPTTIIPVKSFFIKDEIPRAVLDNIIFHIGMVELVSYWKAACPPLVVIKPFKLNAAQIAWWKKLYYFGLGEFFYLNGIGTDMESFMSITSDSKVETSKFKMTFDDSYIVPVGGGKDSAVTLELLKSHSQVTPFVINPRNATSECIHAAGFSKDQTIEFFRKIDPALLDLNSKGFLNGHTPFSALLAFMSLLAGVLTRKRAIALSNEASANETTVIGQDVNHQYSKSFEFEKDFREYVANCINDDLYYFSFLRPLHEIQIARLFSKFPQYFNVFKSCNAGSKTDIWCCNCPKCLFSFIILSPFITPIKLVEIFGENLLDKESLLPVFNQLIGVDSVKPFECIGTVREVNMALSMSISSYAGKLPYLLKVYSDTHAYITYKDFTSEQWLNVFDHENFLTADHFQILKDSLSC